MRAPLYSCCSHHAAFPMEAGELDGALVPLTGARILFNVFASVLCTFVAVSSFLQLTVILVFVLRTRSKKKRRDTQRTQTQKRGSRFVPASSPKDLFVTLRNKRHPCQVRRWGRPNLREHPPRPCQERRRFQGRPKRGHRHSRRGTRISW